MAMSVGSGGFVKSSNRKNKMEISLIKKNSQLDKVFKFIESIPGLTPSQIASFKDATYRSQLQFAQPLSASVPTTTFQSQKGTNNTDRPDEVRLDRNDVFFGFGLIGGIQRADLSSTATPLYGNSPFFTYADENFFAASGEAAALETLYNGRLHVGVGNVKILENVATKLFKKVPDSYYVAAAGGIKQIFPGVDVDNSFYDLVKPLVMFGDQTYTFEWTRGTGTATAIGGASAAATNTAVLLLDGFVVKNLATNQLAVNALSYR